MEAVAMVMIIILRGGIMMRIGLCRLRLDKIFLGGIEEAYSPKIA